MDDPAVFTWSMILASGLAIAFVLKDLLVKISGVTVHYFTKAFTTSIAIQSPGGAKTNVVIWLNNLIEDNCGPKLSHFGIARDIINRSINRRQLFDSYSLFGMESLMEMEGGKPKEEDKTEDIRKQLEPIQSNQRVWFFHNRYLIGVTRKIIPELRMGHCPTEVFTITAYGTRNKQVLIDMLDKERKKLEKKPSKHINYYKHDSIRGTWRLGRRFQPRALASIILKEGITDAIENDVKEFIESKEWYKDRGIPYRRGYLLYGPPGCGKTSFVKAIAGQIGYDIFEVQLSNRRLNDESLSYLMSSISQKAILLFEDIDAVFAARIQDEANSEENDGILGKLKIRESKCQLSFSGLLNAIDGVASEEDYIVFMTTNQIEKLDSALIRPGRIDMRQLIDCPDEQQIAAFFRRFYPDCDDGVAETFAKSVAKLGCNPSIAQIQGIFLKHKYKPENNLQEVDSLVEVCKSNRELGNIYL